MSSEKHEETAKHKKLEKEVKNNSALNTDNGRVELLLPQPQSISLEEKITRYIYISQNLQFNIIKFPIITKTPVLPLTRLSHKTTQDNSM